MFAQYEQRWFIGANREPVCRWPAVTEIVFLRHFETEPDPETPVSEWTLSTDGAAAAEAFLDSDTLTGIDRVYTSPEQKAQRTAQMVAEEVRVPMQVVDALREVDRSGEGFIADHDEYVRMVRDYLENPAVPFQWENREAVEERIRTFLDTVDTRDDRAIAVTHGMLLATLIPRVHGTAPFPFWQGLGFGETIAVDHNELVATMEP